MLQTETSHLWKVRYVIIIIGWRFATLKDTVNRVQLPSKTSKSTKTLEKTYFAYYVYHKMPWKDYKMDLCHFVRGVLDIFNFSIDSWPNYKIDKQSQKIRFFKKFIFKQFWQPIHTGIVLHPSNMQYKQTTMNNLLAFPKLNLFWKPWIFWFTKVCMLEVYSLFKHYFTAYTICSIIPLEIVVRLLCYQIKRSKQLRTCNKQPQTKVQYRYKQLI